VKEIGNLSSGLAGVSFVSKGGEWRIQNILLICLARIGWPLSCDPNLIEPSIIPFNLPIVVTVQGF